MKKLLSPHSPLKNIALQLGLLPNTLDYTKFIILGRSRTGSNFLRSLLFSHPEVLVLGEIFRNTDTIDFDHPQFQLSPKILKIYQNDPISFLRKIVFNKVHAGIKAVGFKLFYYHAREFPFSQLWEELKKQKDIHIIHIKRKNILRTHLSRENALKTGQWVNTDGKNIQVQTYKLDYESLLKDFIQTRAWENEADEFFCDHPKIEVIYEHLSQNTDVEIQKIQKFLNLSKVPVKAQTHKQIQQPLSQIIENYEDLKSRFNNTEWAAFFED